MIHYGVHVLQTPLLIGQGRRLDDVTACCRGYTYRDDVQSTTSFKESAKMFLHEGLCITSFYLEAIVCVEGTVWVINVSLCKGVMHSVLPAGD